MKKYFQKIAKVLRFGVLSLLLLFLLAFVLIQTPKVQNWLVDKLTTSLSGTLNSEVSIKYVNLEFFKTAVMEGILIQDQQADTLLYAEKLKVDVGLFSLFKKRIFLNKVSLEGAVANLIQEQNDSVFNFQFIIDNFSSNTPKTPEENKKSNPWEFGIGNIAIKDTRFQMANKNESGFELNTTVGDLSINAKELDFKTKKIIVSDLNLSESLIAFTLLKGETISQPDTAKLVFPAIGWEVKADDLNLQNTQFSFSNLNQKRQADVLDYNYLNFKGISLKISNISLTDTAMLANINNASLTDHSGLALKKLKGELSMDNQHIGADNLEFKLSQSNVSGSIDLSFEDFEDLADFINKVKLGARFEQSTIAYKELTRIVPLLKNIPIVNTSINENISLSGEIVLQKNSIHFNNFDSKIGTVFKLVATGTINQLTTDPLFDLDIKKLETNRGNFIRLTKNIPLPEGLAQLGEIDFSGQLQGTINNLIGKQFDLLTTSGTQYQGDLSIRGLPDIETTVFNANVDRLITNPSDIKAISGTAFPAMLDSLQFVNFSGDFDGTIYAFDVIGDFITGAGEMKTDLSMDFENDYQSATYDGDLELCDFDLSKILGGDFGKTSLSVETDGSGLNINNLYLNTVGDVSTFEFRNYTYQNLSLNGTFLKKRFEGVAKSDDQNLQFDFKGMIDLNDSLPDMAMVLKTQKVNLKPLNLIDKDLSFSGNLEANLKGNRLDNINGSANLEQFYVSIDSVEYSTDQPISLMANVPMANKKALRFRSEFMDMDIEGKFNLRDFPISIIEFVNGLFLVEELIMDDSISQKKVQAPEQDVVFDFRLKNISPIAKVFLPEFNGVDTSFLKGEFNSTLKKMAFEGDIPNLAYGELEIDSINLTTKGTPNDLKSNFTLKEIHFGEDMNLPLLTLNTFFSNQELNFGINILGKPEVTKNFLTEKVDTVAVQQKLNLGGRFSSTGESYSLSFLPGFILNNENWDIGKNNNIEFSDKKLNINELTFTNRNQEIAINSRGPSPENDISPIEIKITDFNLAEVSEMLSMTNYRLGGMLNGELLLKEPKNNLHYISEIYVESLSYNDNLVGDLAIKAQQETVEKIIGLNVQLTGENQFSIIGDYALQEHYFDIDFQLGRLPLFLADPLMRGIIKDSDGYLTGSIKVKGSPSQPAVNGTLTLNDFSTTAVISNMRYRTQESTIKISESDFDLGEINFKDANNNDAIVRGKIFHNYFDDIVFDLDFNTRAFQFLNTTAADNELYFGNLFLEANVQIKGTPKLPILIIDAATLPNSQLFVQPFSGERAVSQENYIIYANPEIYDQDSIQLLEQRILSNQNAFDLSLNLQVTKDAILYIVIDPLTGDQLISVGSANLSLNINPAGVMTVAGNYIIDNGSYTLNYQQLVKRDFAIEKGSNIIFSGDPMNAGFDVTASYKVRASTYELLANQSALSESELKSASVRTNVVVLMKLRGNLSDPNISFDILIPDAQIDGVSSAVNRKLAELRQNPEELNKQAFGLLLFKSFISESNGSQNFSDAGTAMALSSVSSLLSDQLTHFADKYVEGFEIDIGVESYNTSGTESQNVTKMQMNVSKKLFQDRLTVNVGTNVNISAQDAGSIFNSDYSGIAGDFVLEYQLNEKGNYHIKVFHKSDYNVLEQNNDYKTGAGIIFRKSFNGKNYKE